MGLMKMLKNFSVVTVLITGLSKALIGKIKKAKLASIVARKFTDERASTERRVSVKDGRMFVTITPISRLVITEDRSLPWLNLEQFLTVTIIAKHKIIINAMNVVLIQHIELRKEMILSSQ